MPFSRWGSGRLGSAPPLRAPGSPSHSRSMAIPRSQGSTSPGRLGSGEARLLPHLAGPEKVRAQGPRGAVRLSPCFQALQTLGFSGRRGMDLPACVFHVIPRDRNTGRWAPGATPSSSRQPTSTARCVEKQQTEPLPRGPQATAAGQRGRRGSSRLCAGPRPRRTSPRSPPRAGIILPIFWATGWRALSHGPEPRPCGVSPGRHERGGGWAGPVGPRSARLRRVPQRALATWPLPQPPDVPGVLERGCGAPLPGDSGPQARPGAPLARHMLLQHLLQPRGPRPGFAVATSSCPPGSWESGS